MILLKPFPENMNLSTWFFLGALFFLLLALGLVLRKYFFFKRSQTVKPTNTSFAKGSALAGSPWETTIDYKDQNNKPHQLEYRAYGSRPPLSKKKDTLIVHFDPNKPEWAYVYDFWLVWGTEIAIVFWAVIVLIYSSSSVIT